VFHDLCHWYRRVKVTAIRIRNILLLIYSSQSEHVITSQADELYRAAAGG